MNKFYSHKIKINKEQNLNRLDQALSKLSDLSRSQIKILLNDHNIKINGKVIENASYKVKEGEEYNLNLENPKALEFEPENIPINIIFEDEDIIIIDKKAGMVTHPAPGNFSGTLVNALLYYTKNKLSNFQKNYRPGIVHRLDKDTSGIMVVAKNNDSHLKLASQFKDHTISRKYKALVWGIPNNQIIEGHIQRDRINRKKMSFNKENNGKFSKTEIILKKSYTIASLIECKLYTGRTHQIRVHMKSLNSSLIGDKVYGNKNINQYQKKIDTYNKFLFLKNFTRQALHADHLGFIHPKTNKYIEFNSDLPNDINNLLDLLLKY